MFQFLISKSFTKNHQLLYNSNKLIINYLVREFQINQNVKQLNNDEEKTINDNLNKYNLINNEYSNNQEEVDQKINKSNFNKSTKSTNKSNLNYKNYKNLNHQKNEIKNRIRSNKKNLDNYEQFSNEIGYLNKSRDLDPNFGKLKKDNKSYLKSEFLDDDPDNMERMEVVTNKKPRNYYLFEIRDAIYKDKKLGVHKALELYREMKLDRKVIDADFYKMLIKGCSLVGYVDKAFELYDEYQQLELPTINRTIVTSMFNCCANSPDKQLGIKKAKEFYDDLRLKNFDFNIVHYKILIKTFGLLGDLDTAFAFIDTLIEHQFRLDTEIFNNLLIGVASNKHEGLGLATNIIQSMRFLNIKPDIYTYNLLYRIVRDCNFGTEKDILNQIKFFGIPSGITSEFLRSVLYKQRSQLKRNYLKLLDNQQQQTKQLNAGKSTDLITEKSDYQLTTSVKKDNELMCLNFLGTNINSIDNQSKIIEINFQSLKQPENRLKLIGGIDHLLNYMYEDNVKPDIKTISLLTSLIPNNKEHELKLVKFIDELDIKADADFYNMLIRRANFRGEFEVAKEYLKLMTSKRLPPNIQTYGVMAMSCFSSNEINSFLNDMDEFGVRPNIVIMSQLIRNAITRFNFYTVGNLISRLEKYGIKPTRKLAEYFVIADELGNKYLELYEKKGKLENVNKLKNSYLIFKKRMNDYLSENPKIVNENILDQFKTEPLPRNEELHKFKIQMTKVLKEKRRFLNEFYEKELNDK